MGRILHYLAIPVSLLGLVLLLHHRESWLLLNFEEYLSEEALDLTVYTLYWVIAAILLNALVQLVFFDIVVSRSIRAPVPRVLKDLGSVVIYAAVAACITSLVFHKDITAFVAALGASTVLIGFALRNVLSDLFTGLALNFEQPFRIGDWIGVQTSTGHVVGRVREINWRSTHLETEDSRWIVVPNSRLGEQTVLNFWRPAKENQGDSSKHRIRLLKQVDLFRDLKEEDFETLAASLRVRQLAAEEAVIEKGGEGDSMFLLMEGLLAVLTETEKGEWVRIDRIRPGEFFGEMSLLTGEARSATVRAITDAVVYEVTAESMTALFGKRPELVESTSQIMAERRLHQQTTLTELDAQRRTNLAAQLLRKMKGFLGV